MFPRILSDRFDQIRNIPQRGITYTKVIFIEATPQGSVISDVPVIPSVAVPYVLEFDIFFIQDDIVRSLFIIPPHHVCILYRYNFVYAPSNWNLKRKHVEMLVLPEEDVLDRGMKLLKCP